MDKRGIAPLVATLLLISFAIALGVVIMNFGRAQVELEAQCAIDVGMRFSEIGGEQQLCYDQATKKLTFTIQNGANINVEGLIVNVIGTQKAQTFEINDAKMTRAGTYVGSVDYDTTVGGEIRQLKITPKIILYDQEQICIERSIILEDVPTC